MGWQKFQYGKMIPKAITFLIVGLLFFAVGISHTSSLISNIVGILIGIILAYYGISVTVFEERKGSWYFRPNIWIGSSVMILFLLRMVYRLYHVFNLSGIQSGIQADGTPSLQNISSQMGNTWFSGLTLITFSYYIVYYIMIYLKKRKLQSEQKRLVL